jgi:hypothetical protein
MAQPVWGKTRAVLIVAALLAVSSSAYGVDANGHFQGGAGVGSITCPKFLDAMAYARQRGGNTTMEGAKVYDPYWEFLAGFQTAFNLLAPGVYDVWAPLGKQDGKRDAIHNGLYVIEAWCVKNPEKEFYEGVIELARSMHEKLNQ